MCDPFIGGAFSYLISRSNSNSPEEEDISRAHVLYPLPQQPVPQFSPLPHLQMGK